MNLYHIYGWSKELCKISEIYDFIVCIRQLDEYNVFNTNALIELIKNMDVTYEMEQNYIAYSFRDNSLSNAIINYLEMQYKLYNDNDIIRPSKSEKDKCSYTVDDEMQHPYVYFCASKYLTEQMFGYETAKYTAEVINNDSNKQFYIDQVLPELIYIFTIPNIFIRRNYIDIFLKLYNRTNPSIQPLGFHDDMKGNFSPYPVKDSELRLFTKEWLLCMSLNYIPMLEQIFYCEYYEHIKRVKSNSDEVLIKKEMKNTLETFIEENSKEFFIQQRYAPNKTEKKDIIKIYEAMRKYLYNNYGMKRWSDALDLNYLKHYKKLIISLIEYERTNIFERSTPLEFFVPLSMFKLKDKYLINEI